MLIIENEGDDKLSKIKDAIENKYEITFWYRGIKVSDPAEKRYTKQNYRRVQPVALGKSKGTGKWMLRGYQTTGVTNTKNQKWKTFIVDEIKDGSIEVLYDSTGREYKTFVPKNDYKTDGSDKKMDNDKAIYYTDVNKEAGTTTPNDKEPKIDNETEDNENLETTINESYSSGFLKWIYNTYG
jgi:hypothetical protein